MALVVKDRVKETSTSIGTGNFTLAGAVAGFQAFSAALANGDTTYYAITDAGTGDFEVGLGTYSAGVLTRTTILESTNAGAAVSFQAGEKEVFITYPAEKAVYADASGNISVPGLVDGRDLAADGSKLDGIEAGATADQTGAEIKSLYEAQANTNAYTDAEKSKLAGIEAGATADQTASEILTAIKTVDGSASGLDADLLDGQEGSYYTGYTDTAAAAKVSKTGDTMTGNLSFGDNNKAIFGADSDLLIYHDGTDNVAYSEHPANLKVGRAGGGAFKLILPQPAGAGGNTIEINSNTTGGHQRINAAQTQLPLDIQHGGSTKLSIDSGGVDITGDARVTGKGKFGNSTFTASADADDLLIYQTSGNAGLTIRGGSSSSNNIFFADSDVDVGKISYYHADNSMRFTTNTVEAAKLFSSGSMYLRNDLVTGYISTHDTNGSFIQAQGGHTYAYTQIRGRSTTYGSGGDAVFTVVAGYLDTKIKFLLNGNGYFDGVADAGSADYAEMFEWDDGNPNNEDRVGYSVVLTNGNKIRKATSSDAAGNIIGVVSGRPAVVGDTASLGWHGKWETDDFARRKTGDVTFYRWDIEEDGETKTLVHRADDLPSDVTIPNDAEEIVSEAELISSDYDNTAEYTPRRERQQWDAIGMLGKLRLRVGQPTRDSWIKLRDIATDDDGNVTVEEWLVR